jgi:predicted transcriptional regulator
MNASGNEVRSDGAWKERELLLLLQKKGKATLSEIRQEFPQDSRQKLHIALTRLVSKGIIEQVRHGARYVYKPKPLQSWIAKLRALDAQTILANLLSFGLVTERDLKEVEKLSQGTKGKS